MDGSAAAPASPTSIGTTPNAAGAPPPASSGQPAPAGNPAGAAPRPAAGGQTAAQQQAAIEKYLYQRQREDGTTEDIDISGWEHEVKIRDGLTKKVRLGDLVRDYRTRTASFEKFEQAAKLRQQVEAEKARVQRTIEQLKDPKRVMEHLRHVMGDKFSEFLDQQLAERVAHDRLPPNVRQRVEQMQAQERQFREREEAIAEREAAHQRHQQEQAKARAQAQARRWKQEWPQEFVAMGLSSNETVINRAIEMTVSELQRLRRAGQPIDAQTVRDTQRSTVDFLRSLVGDVVRSSDPQSLRSLAGDDAIAAMAKARDASIDAQPGRTPPVEQPAQRLVPKGAKRVDLMEIARGIGR